MQSSLMPVDGDVGMWAVTDVSGVHAAGCGGRNRRGERSGGGGSGLVTRAGIPCALWLVTHNSHRLPIAIFIVLHTKQTRPDQASQPRTTSLPSRRPSPTQPAVQSGVQIPGPINYAFTVYARVWYGQQHDECKESCERSAAHGG